MALGPTQPLTEMSNRNLLGGKGRPANKVDNLTAILSLYPSSDQIFSSSPSSQTPSAYVPPLKSKTSADATYYGFSYTVW
jgi:hypothetical protein